MKCPKVLALCALFCSCALPVTAGVNSPVHMVVDKSARIADVLTVLSQKTAVPIIVDDTVIDTINVSDLREPGIEPLLNALAISDPGLTWLRVYLPKVGALPSGSALVQELRSLKPGTRSGLIYGSPTANSVISFSVPERKAAIAPPKGMRVVYLVTNETVRAQHLTDKEVMEAKARQAAKTPLQVAMESLASAADAMHHMTPEQQLAALPALRQMLDGMDPALRNQLLPPPVLAAKDPQTEMDRYMNSLNGIVVNRNGSIIQGGFYNSANLNQSQPGATTNMNTIQQP